MKKRLLLSAALSVLIFVQRMAVMDAFAAQTAYPSGVTVEENKNPDWDADYTVTFVYEDRDKKDAVNVTVSGNLQFYSPDDEVVKNFINTGNSQNARAYSVFEYKKGMFNTGYELNDAVVAYELKETGDERFELTLPLPGSLYYYDYTIIYADGSTVTIQDPMNPSPENENNGHNSGHSIIYVGNKDRTLSGQEYIYERSDGKKGTCSFVTYDAIDGTKQPLGIYLPYNYDADKTYKTIYISHGGGGNEAEWMGIGAIPNIMDNLIADKLIAEAVVVTMDNTYFREVYGDLTKEYFDAVAENFKECMIPYMEENYSVSKDAGDRALCGLSMGAMITCRIMQEDAGLFGSYGCFSGSNFFDISEESINLNSPPYLVTTFNPLNRLLCHS